MSEHQEPGVVGGASDNKAPLLKHDVEQLAKDLAELGPRSAKWSFQTNTTASQSDASDCDGDDRDADGPMSPGTLPGSWTSQSSVASCPTPDTLMSPTIREVFPIFEEPGMDVDSKFELPRSLSSSIPFNPFRPRHRIHRESWDSGYLSLNHARRRSHTRTPSLSGISDYSSVRSLTFNDGCHTTIPEVPGPSNDPTVKEDIIKTEGSSKTHEDGSDEADWDETSSNSTVPAEDAAGRILTYTLEVLGLKVDDMSLATASCRNLVTNFVSDISYAVEAIPNMHNQSHIKDCTGDSELTRLPTNASNSSKSSGTRGSQHSSNRGDRGKRKAPNGGDDDQDGDDEFDEGGRRGGDPGPSKRPRVEPAFRMGCPFRKKNPLRFNVRDHRLCALTLFTDTAELRRHIQDCHRRPLPSPYQCLRCREQFKTEGEQRNHQLFLTGLCPIIEASSDSHRDPEDGIDNSIAEKLRSKKGRVSDSVEVQWQKMWELLFPGTAVEPYQFQAVMEHFELYQSYSVSIPFLRESLGQIGLSQRGLDTLSSILDNHFIGLFEQMNEEGKYKEYHNRQPKPQTQGRAKRESLRERLHASHRDSGVDVNSLDDEGTETPLTKLDSEESNSAVEFQAAYGLGGPSGEMPVNRTELSGIKPNLNTSAFLNSLQDSLHSHLDLTNMDDYSAQFIANAAHNATGPTEFRYQDSGDGADQQDWQLDPSILATMKPMDHTNAWLYQQDGRF